MGLALNLKKSETKNGLNASLPLILVKITCTLSKTRLRIFTIFLPISSGLHESIMQ